MDAPKLVDQLALVPHHIEPYLDTCQWKMQPPHAELPLIPKCLSIIATCMARDISR